jgi:hypothetical protein
MERSMFPTSATVSHVISAHNAVLERYNAFNRRLHAELEKSGLVAVMISPSVARNAARGFFGRAWARKVGLRGHGRQPVRPLLIAENNPVLLDSVLNAEDVFELRRIGTS